MIFGLSGSAQGNVRYSIILDDQEALAKLNDFKVGLQQLTQPSQGLVQTMGGLGGSFATMGASTKTLGTDLRTMGTSMTGLQSPTASVNANMGALSNNFKLLSTTVKTDTTDINAFRTGITALSAPTQSTTANMQKMVGELGPLSSGFQKTSGAAKDMIVQQSKVGTSVKDNISRFTTFGASIGTTIFSLVNLVRQYRDVNDLQIRVDASTRKVSLAQEQVDKTTTKVKEATAKYGKGSKEVAIAVRDQTQAEQLLSVQTRNLGENQEALRDTQENLAFTTGTTLLSTITTGISGFRDFGLSVKGGIPLLKSFGGAIVGLPAVLKGLGVSAIGAAGGIAPLTIAVIGFIKQAEIVATIVPKMIDSFKTDKLAQKAQDVKDIFAKMGELPLTGGIFDQISKILGADVNFDKLKQLADLADKINAKRSDLEKITIQLAAAEARLTKATTEYVKALGTAITEDDDYWANQIKIEKAEVARLKSVKDLSTGTKDLTVNIKTAAEARAEEIKQMLIGADMYNEEINIRNRAIAVARIEIDAREKHQKAIKDATAAIAEEADIVEQRAIAVAEKHIEIMKRATDTAKEEADSIRDRAVAVAQLGKKIEEEVTKLKDKRFELLGVFNIKSVNEQRDKILKTLKRMLPEKIEKKIDAELEFSTKVDATKQAFQVFLGQALVMDDKSADKIAKTTIKMIDDKFKGEKGPFAGLRQQIEAAIADPNTPDKLRQLLLGYDWTNTGEKINTDVQTGVDSKPIIVPITKPTPEQIAAVRNSIAEADIIPPQVVLAKPNVTEFNKGITESETKVKDIAKTIPAISANNQPAIKAVDVIVKRIESLEKLKPQISLQNNKAIKTVDVVAKRIDSLEKIKPSISLDNKAAIKAVDVVARRIEDLNRTVTVRVRTVGGSVSAQGGFHTSQLPEDTVIFAHKGESAHIGPGQAKASSGGGSGPVFIEIRETLMDREILRQYRAEGGKSRYRFGA